MKRSLTAPIFLVILIITAVTFWYWKGPTSIVSPNPNTTSTTTPNSATSTPQTTTPSITYTTDGKIDTSDWVEYRSEYGGFSVRAPKERALISCARGCNPLVNGETFLYTLTNGFEEDPGLEGMTIAIIQKGNDALNIWVEKHIASPAELIQGVEQGIVADKQMVTIGGHSALRFDVHAPAQSAVGLSTKDIAIYPNGGRPPTPQTMSQVLFDYPAVLYGRVYVVDLGNRFALITEVLSYEKTSVEAYNDGNATHGGKVELLDDKTLGVVYDAILSSFKSFNPTTGN